MLTIRPLASDNADCFNRADTRYLAGELVQIRVTRKGFVPDYVPVSSATWQTYQPPRSLQRLLTSGSVPHECFFAFLDDQFAGQAVVAKASHGLAELIDLQVDVKLRRQSIASSLLDACVDWAQKQRCHGLLAQTTDFNPVACQFFDHSSFQLGGVDKLRYWADDGGGLVPSMRPSALTFYRFF